MNERLRELAEQAGLVRNGDFGMKRWEGPHSDSISDQDLDKFAKMIIEETLNQVDEQCYGRGENQWYYDDDKRWIRLHFGYGELKK